MKTGQAGDAYGGSNIHISNRVGARGLTIENTSKNTGLASCDAAFKTNETLRNICLEDRSKLAN